jgi:hypothetical protein
MSIGTCSQRRKIQLGVHGDVSESVTKLYVDGEIDESRRRAQSTGLKGRPNQVVILPSIPLLHAIILLVEINCVHGLQKRG